MSIMDKGRFTEPFEKEKSDKKMRMRMGKNVPEGAANIAYIHTPNITADDGVSFIDNAYTADNTITLTERETLAVADEQGYLQYAEITNKDEVHLKEIKTGSGKTSSNNFPTRKLTITNLFHDEALSIESAMHYQVIIEYHYDKLVSKPNDKGEYLPALYKGNQIDITDIEGNSLLFDEKLKAKIYVQGIFGYPNVYRVIVLLNKATTQTETICIKYNHLDEPKNAQEIRTVKGRVQLYVDKKNLVTIDGKTKHMMESGKVRILNPGSAFLEKTISEVIQERSSANPKTIYAIEEKNDGKGYQILVPDRTEKDPRTAKHFQFIVTAEYRNKQGNLVRHSTGLIEDSLMHQKALLSHERSKYNSEFKTIGLLNGQDILNARDSIEASLPITTPAIPDTAEFAIKDTEGNVFYSSTKTAANKSDVETIISENFARAKSSNLSTTNWPLAQKTNTVLKELPFYHRYSIIPEYQKTKWGFEYTLDGEAEMYINIAPDGTVMGDETITWSTKWGNVPLTVNGVGTVEYLSDGHFNIEFSPRIVPDIELPKYVKNFRWNQPVIKSGANVSVSLVGKAIKVKATTPPIQSIGKIWNSTIFPILSEDGMKVLNQIPNGDWRQMFEIPANIPSTEVMLRIERGLSTNGLTGTSAAHAVNYRFRVSKGGVVRYPVDQFQDELGMNRIRMKDVVNKKGFIADDIRLDTVAWTSQANYQSIPVYAVKHKEARHIYADRPRVEEGAQKHLGWYPIIKDGDMVKRMIMPIIEDVNNPPTLYKQYPSLKTYASTASTQKELDFVYGIPEYRRQEFFRAPIILIDSERPRLLTGNSLQVKNRNIVTQREPHEHHTNKVWVKRNKKMKEIRIKDIDAVKGIFYLLDYVDEEDEVYVSYQYEERFYEYRGFPTTYPESSGSMTVKREAFYTLDLNPMPGHFYTAAHEQGFKYIPVEHQMKDAKSLQERQSNELSAVPIYLYMIPKEVRDPSTGTIISGTSRSRTIFHTDQSQFFNPNHVEYNHAFFLLAELMNQNPMHLKEDTTFLDTRVRGGGIKTDVSREEIERRDPSSLHNWDIGFFDGQAYQENGVFVVQVDPERFQFMSVDELEEDKENIKRATEKYKAHGVLPLYDFKHNTGFVIGELIINGEFEEGKRCGYFSEGLSKGNWEIIYKELGAGDNYVMRLVGDATFGMRIPGFNFGKDEKYRFEIKGMKDPNVITTTRPVGEIKVKYEDDTEESYLMGELTQSYWLSVLQEFQTDPAKDVKEVAIHINNIGTRHGTMYYDYVSLVSLGNVVSNHEVVEL